MNLIEKIRANTSFQILDEASGLRYSYDDLPNISWVNESRALVFCYLDNSFRSISFLLKALEGNHVLVLLSLTLPANLKELLEQNYAPNYIFDTTRPKIAGYKEVEAALYNKMIDKHHDLHAELKVLLSTSGTTGSPKLVKLSDINLLSNAEAIAHYLPISNIDTVPLNLPVHYSYGLSVLTSNAISGAKVCVGSLDVMSKGFWENFQKYQYVTLAGVPYVYEMLDRIGFTKMQLPSLRYFTQAGGRLRDDLVSKYADFAKEHGKLFYVMYGQTEATARMSYLHPDDLLSHIGSIGKPIPGGRFELNEETSELHYEGSNVYGGYAECVEDLRTFKSPALLSTGDLARVDEQGFYYITGRSKRFVKIFGNRINLDELEAALSKRFGAFYPCLGWQDKAVLVYSTNANEEPSKIVSWLNGEYKLHPTSFKLRTIDAIPLTANGKPDYKLLLSVYEGR